MNFSCDVNKANLFFLEDQGKIRVYKSDEFTFRYYVGKAENRLGWLFQLLPRESIQTVKMYLEKLLDLDSSPNFILLTEEQKFLLEDCVNNYFPKYKIDFQTDVGDWDYIYSVEKMAALLGKDFQKKRNHISRFMRIYEGEWRFELYDYAELSAEKLDHIKHIYSAWLENQDYEENEFLISEKKSIEKIAAGTINDDLQLMVGILYINNMPSAFLLASVTEDECINVHFEKCLEIVAQNGGLAVLNQQFAQQIMSNYPKCKYINREEDLNIPGLRKSKLSYKPEFLIKKYYGKLELKTDFE
ncbi:MAG: phosphatidylglycerol lysyltransferase domain-containing protein [Treponema sp.]|nr:phosphatidylglycerol lysyltransferase domain-containing protein [Treponema sp.]